MVVCLAGQSALPWWRILLDPSRLSQNNYLRQPCRAANSQDISDATSLKKVNNWHGKHDDTLLHLLTGEMKRKLLTTKPLFSSIPLQCQLVAQYQKGRRHNTDRLSRCQPLSCSKFRDRRTLAGKNNTGRILQVCKEKVIRQRYTYCLCKHRWWG
jgi:hypothetical protein